MKKQKKHEIVKKPKKWITWLIFTSIGIIAIGLSTLIVSSLMKGGTIPTFDKENGVRVAEKFASFKNRYPENEDHDKAKNYLFGELKGYTNHVTEQNFDVVDSVSGETVRLTNIIASFYPDNPERIMFCAHYDTPKKSVLDSVGVRILGATDNSSGIAVLLELARLMHQQQPAVGVDIVFFDATTSLDYGDSKNLFVGVQKFVEAMPDYKPEYAINLNSVGVPNLAIYADEFSNQFASNVFERLTRIGNELNINIFKEGKKITVADNHLILIKNRIQAVDLFDYDWQKKIGTEIDAKSLDAIGTILVHHIY